jgi:hypothetical protein
MPSQRCVGSGQLWRAMWGKEEAWASVSGEGGRLTQSQERERCELEGYHVGRGLASSARDHYLCVASLGLAGAGPHHNETSHCARHLRVVVCGAEERHGRLSDNRAQLERGAG